MQVAETEVEGNRHEERGETMPDVTEAAEETEVYEGPEFRKNPVLLAQFKEKLEEHIDTMFKGRSGRWRNRKTGNKQY